MTSQDFWCSLSEAAEEVVQLLAGCCRSQSAEGTGLDLFGSCQHSSPCNPRQCSPDTDPPHTQLSQFGNAEPRIHHQHVKRLGCHGPDHRCDIGLAVYPGRIKAVGACLGEGDPRASQNPSRPDSYTTTVCVIVRPARAAS